MEQKRTVWSKTVFNHHHHTTYLIHYSYLNTFVFLGLRFMLAAYCYGDPGYCVSYNSKRRLVQIHRYFNQRWINVKLGQPLVALDQLYHHQRTEYNNNHLNCFWNNSLMLQIAVLGFIVIKSSKETFKIMVNYHGKMLMR